MPSMCTGPLVSSRTRLAIRNASTTPWQYPRGVILTTSMAVSRVYAGGLGDPHEEVRFGKRRSWFAARQLVVLGAESQPVDLVGHVGEPRVGIVLAHVRAERGALAVDEFADVHPGRDQFVRRALDRRADGVVATRLLRHLFPERLHHRARDRRVVDLVRSPRLARAQQ